MLASAHAAALAENRLVFARFALVRLTATLLVATALFATLATIPRWIGTHVFSTTSAPEKSTCLAAALACLAFLPLFASALFMCAIATATEA